MTRLCVFDLGNVILPFEHRQIAVKLRDRSALKKDFTAEQMFQYMFDFVGGLIDPYEEGNMSSLEFFERIRDRFQIRMTFQEFAQVWNFIFREDAGVNEVILDLKAKGYPLFLLSNTNELHFSHILESYPIVHVFDEWVLSFEVGAKKPKKRIYEVIFEKMDIEPGDVFYTDDMAAYVEAARSLGIDGVVFENSAQLRKALEERTGGGVA